MEVLVVDDDDDATALMALLLGRKGYRVKTAGTLTQARSLLGACHFDALVTDLHLPDGMGIELLDKGRPEGLLKAIVVTGAADDLARGLPKLFDLVLKKPVDSQALLKALPPLSANGNWENNQDKVGVKSSS